MQKYRYIIGAVCTLLLLNITACKKSFLEVVPKKESLLQTWSDYNLLMNGSNFYVIGGGGGNAFSTFELMGDEVAAESYNYDANVNYAGEAMSLFQWQTNVFPLNNPNGTYVSLNVPPFLAALTTNTYTLNVIINGIDKATDGTAQQKLEVKSEAMAERAYTNFLFLNYFTQPYNSATAATDPGYPYTTVADVQGETFARGTVQQSYDALINDLTTAIPNLSINPTIRTRMSKAGAEALLGKVYLSMNRYADALNMLNAAFTDMGKMSAPPVLYNYNQTFAAGGSFTSTSPSVGPSSPFISTNDITESLWACMTTGTNNQNAFPNNFITINSNTVSLFDQSDWRLQFYTNLQNPQLGSPDVIPGGRLNRYNLVYARIGIELPDLLLMKAEVEARTGDLAAAVQDVQTLRMNRMPASKSAVPTAATTNQTALIQFILNERVREFASTGFRWLDMRRLKNDPLFSSQPAAVHVFYDDAQNTSTSYTLTPARLTLKIPPYLLQQNPGWVDNP